LKTTANPAADKKITIVNIRKVCILGGSGFIGRHVVHLLSAKGYSVRVAVRRRDRAKALALLPRVEVVELNIDDPAAIHRALAQQDAVINLVGILHERKKNRDFERLHVELARKLAVACDTNQVKRFIHISALAADVAAPSAYLRSKALGERVITEMGARSSWRYTVFRPSVVFGPEDRFLNLLAILVKYLPIIFLGSPKARFQPIYVEDVAETMVLSLSKPETFGKHYDLCGPERYTLRELVEFVCHTMGKSRVILNLNDVFSYWQAWWMEKLPIKLLTRDNYNSMKVDSICGCDYPPIFEIQPKSMRAIVPEYLTGSTPRMRGRRRLDRSGR
jgi:uncharacterized protein YbjT (DUF2867 family)